MMACQLINKCKLSAMYFQFLFASKWTQGLTFATLKFTEAWVHLNLRLQWSCQLKIVVSKYLKCAVPVLYLFHLISVKLTLRVVFNDFDDFVYQNTLWNGRISALASSGRTSCARTASSTWSTTCSSSAVKSPCQWICKETFKLPAFDVHLTGIYFLI